MKIIIKEYILYIYSNLLHYGKPRLKIWIRKKVNRIGQVNMNHEGMIVIIIYIWQLARCQIRWGGITISNLQFGRKDSNIRCLKAWLDCFFSHYQSVWIMLWKYYKDIRALSGRLPGFIQDMVHCSHLVLLTSKSLYGKKSSQTNGNQQLIF